MRILKPGKNKKYIATCGICDCVFECGIKDMEHSAIEGDMWVACPSCDELIYKSKMKEKKK